MPIGKSINYKRIKTDMENILKTECSVEHKKDFCGKLLMDYARRYSFADANKIVEELKLESIGVKMACPIVPFKS